ncbi:HhH-GPD-type base excision DNA repair protein [Nocardioides korecus]
MAVHITGDADADQVLTESPFALLLGMLLDQQFPMERAFAGPARLQERFGPLDPERVAAADPEEFAALCAQPPAVHRFPGSMAARIQAVARVVVEEHGGRAEKIWTEAADGADLLRRMTALPGFGQQKAKIFVALLAKQLGVRPEGWEAAAGDYALEGHRSVADVVDAASLEKVRAHKKEQKAAARKA